MDREPDTRERRGAGYRLRGAPGRICARVSRSTGVRRPTSLSPSGPAAPQQPGGGRSGGADGGLAATSAGSGSGANATAPADRRRSAFGPSADPGRGHSPRSGLLLCVDARLLFLERRLGMGWRPLCRSAQANRCLGGWPLGQTRPRLCVDRRRLAVAQPSHSSIETRDEDVPGAAASLVRSSESVMQAMRSV